MVDTNDSIYTKVTPLVITKCVSLIHLHVAHLAYLSIQCYLAHHEISIGHLVCPGRLALPTHCNWESVVDDRPSKHVIFDDVPPVREGNKTHTHLHPTFTRHYTVVISTFTFLSTNI